MDWEFFVQQVVNGVTLGSVYALVALGYSLVYGILKLLNFAHGDVYMIGAFIGYGVLALFGGSVDPVIPIPLLILLMFLTAMIGCAVLGAAIERFAYRPLRNAPRIAPLISALGVSFFLQNSALLLFSPNFRSYDSFSFYDGRLFLPLTAGPLHISPIRILVISSALGLMVALTLFVGRTQLGRAMRATAFDREAAAMMGIDVDRVIVIAFLIGSALAGAAGVMIGLVFQRVFHTMGFVAGLKGFAAAVVGGIGSIPGAVIGGLVMGISEYLVVGYVSSTYRDGIAFVILILVLLVKPAGLLGRHVAEKV